MSTSKPAVEEEDLDDLDDVLEQFTQPQPPPPKATSLPPPSSSTSNTASKSKSPPLPEADDPLLEDFAKQLAEMMQGLEGVSKGEENTESSGVEKGKETAAEEEDSFQKAIQQAMEKLQDSDDTLKADSRSGTDSLEGLLASLGDFKLGEDGAEGEGAEGLEGMLETMMSQLMSKEILYEPLKELDTKYPEYLSQHSATLSPEDLSRYTDQKVRVTQIVALFENSSYSDDNPEQSTEVLRLMNEMQSYGSPPSEIMGPMPPGFDLGADGLPNIPDGCVVC